MNKCFFIFLFVNIVNKFKIIFPKMSYKSDVYNHSFICMCYEPGPMILNVELFLAESLGVPFLSPYLQSIGSDFRHGANFATLASTVLLPNTSLFVSGISPFSLAIQLNQMKQFKVRVDEFHSSNRQGIFYTIHT